MECNTVEELLKTELGTVEHKKKRVWGCRIYWLFFFMVLNPLYVYTHITPSGWWLHPHFADEEIKAYTSWSRANLEFLAMSQAK